MFFCILFNNMFIILRLATTLSRLTYKVMNYKKQKCLFYTPINIPKRLFVHYVLLTYRNMQWSRKNHEFN